MPRGKPTGTSEIGVVSEVQPTPEDYNGLIEASLTELQRLIHTPTKNKSDQVEKTIAAYEENYAKILGEPRVTNGHRMKLKNLYRQLLKESEAEADELRSCLELIGRVKQLRTERRIALRESTKASRQPIRRGALMMLLQQSAATLPLFIGRPGESPPPLCGATPADSAVTLSVGDMVAARVTPTSTNTDEPPDENWILAEVISYNLATSKYEIDDIDEEQKERYTLSRKKIIPLPMWRSNPETDPDALHSEEALVWALYPQTTCFYRGVVQRQPATPADVYLVKFEDPSYPDGYSPGLAVPQRYVVACSDVDATGKSGRK